MNLDALPKPSARTEALAVLLQVVHALLATFVAFSLTLGLGLLVAGRGSSPAFAVALIAFIAFEIGVAAWLILRRRKLWRLSRQARESILGGDAVGARKALVGLLGFWEFRLKPAEVYYGLALADLLEGEHLRARALLERCGASPAAQELLVLLLLEEGRLERAASFARELLTRRPGRLHAWLLHAACQQALGHTDVAASIARQASARWPRSSAANQALACIERGEFLRELLLREELGGSSS